MLRTLRFLPLCLLLIACDSGSPPSGGAQADTGATTDTGDTGTGSGDTAVDSGSDAAPDGGDAGTPCLENTDCASSICLAIDTQGNGVCVTPCTTANDFAGGEDCVVFPGTDAQRVCVDGDLC
ncbi:MAG: hypothetical protein ACKO56_05735, partial [Paracoccaceae bacterium]